MHKQCLLYITHPICSIDLKSWHLGPQQNTLQVLSWLDEQLLGKTKDGQISFYMFHQVKFKTF